jgi:hypothetical protein
VCPKEDIRGVEFYLGMFDVDQQALLNLAVVSGSVFSVKFNQNFTTARTFLKGDQKP